MTPEEIQKTEHEIVEVLKNVYDPEIPINIYDLGLIYDIDYDADGVVRIRMTLTAPNCPVADSLVDEVRSRVAEVASVKEVVVDIVFDPPWDKNMMSEEALMELGML